MANKVIAISGYFDPLHVGHLDYIKMAKDIIGKKGKLVVILNNDNQAYLKKKKVFMSQEDRRKILEAIKWVDEVYISIDEDETVCKSLMAIQPTIFANGGDRVQAVEEEDKLCQQYGIQQMFNLGKKIRASSEILKEWEKK